ncbi:MAG: winged helix-turn-helix domain-containing protein [Nanoarchaeales archaeon]
MEERKEIDNKLIFIQTLLKKEERSYEIKKTRKEKNKEFIIELFQKNKELTLQDVAKTLNLSIQRASEYLSELFREGKITFYRKNKKKYFRLLEKW